MVEICPKTKSYPPLLKQKLILTPPHIMIILRLTPPPPPSPLSSPPFKEIECSLFYSNSRETTFIILQTAPIDNYETKGFSGESCYELGLHVSELK